MGNMGLTKRWKKRLRWGGWFGLVTDTIVGFVLGDKTFFLFFFFPRN